MSHLERIYSSVKLIAKVVETDKRKYFSLSKRFKHRLQMFPFKKLLIPIILVGYFIIISFKTKFNLNQQIMIGRAL